MSSKNVMKHTFERNVIMTTGEKIRQVRISHLETQEYFAEKIGISRPHLSKIETGKENASDSVLRLISQLYGTDYTWLSTDAEGQHISYKFSQKDLLSFRDVMTKEPSIQAKTLRKTFDLLHNQKIKLNSQQYFCKNMEEIVDAISNFYNRSDLHECNTQDVEIICAYIEKKMICALKAFQIENLDEKQDK